VTISIQSSTNPANDGAIVFEFKENNPKTCDCSSYGWIQHLAPVDSDGWKYDNNAGVPGGYKSDPSKGTQPTHPGDPGWTGNPWYGGDPPGGAAPGFAENPTPQPKIGDKPTQINYQFKDQLVCVDTGEALVTYAWGPTGSPAGDPKTLPGGFVPPP
jgi:hypothetical protein